MGFDLQLLVLVPSAIFVGGGAIILVWFLTRILIPEYLKDRHVARCAAQADDDALEEIYRLIESLGEEAPNGYVLGKTNRLTSDTSCQVSIPLELKDFPWAGRTFRIDMAAVPFQFDASKDVTFHEVAGYEKDARFLGRVFRPVAVPRFKTKTGKLRNKYSADHYLSMSDDLKRALVRLCPRFPTALLWHLLSSGTRIGTSASWLQNAEFQYCDICKRRMALVIQVTGYMLHRKKYQSGYFYLFGCKQHPDEMKMVPQFD